MLTVSSISREAHRVDHQRCVRLNRSLPRTSSRAATPQPIRPSPLRTQATGSACGRRASSSTGSAMGRVVTSIRSGGRLRPAGAGDGRRGHAESLGRLPDGGMSGGVEGSRRAPRRPGQGPDATSPRCSTTSRSATTSPTTSWPWARPGGGARRCVEAVDPQPGERILDLAAGTGTSSVPFARAGRRRRADRLLPRHAARWASGASPHLPFVAGDGMHLPFRDAVLRRRDDLVRSAQHPGPAWPACASCCGSCARVGGWWSASSRTPPGRRSAPSTPST